MAAAAATTNLKQTGLGSTNSPKSPKSKKLLKSPSRKDVDSFKEPEPKKGFAEVARAKLRKARLQAKKEQLIKAKEAEEKFRKWNEWEETFFTAGPTKLALTHGVTSTAPQQQTTFIKMNDAVRKAKAATKRVFESPAGPDVQRILDLQDTKGVWSDSEELNIALGGYIPDCPEGIVKWKWASALAMAFLRSRPDQFGFTAEAYEKGLQWVNTPPWLLEAASESLPPLNNYFPLDGYAVKEGRWRDTETILMNHCGYDGFLNYEPPKILLPGEAEAAALEKPRTPKTTKSSKDHHKIIDMTKFNTHQGSLHKEFKNLTKQHGKKDGSGSGGGDVNSSNSSQRNIENLRQVWELPCLVADEKKRLHESKGIRNLTQENKWKEIKIIKNNDKVEIRRKKLIAETAARNLARQEKARNFKNNLLNSTDDVLISSSLTMKSHDSYADNLKEIITSEALVVSCCEKYDRYLLLVSKIAHKCSIHWREARLNSERQHSFDELTEMLGPHIRARHGLNDWRANPVLGVQSLTLAVIHGVVRWRKALVDGGRPPKPFIWNNKNILLSIITGLEFLESDFPELVSWYGPEFPWKRNPFSRAATIDERPKTPNSAYMKILVDGELVDKINDRLLANQKAAQELVDVWETKLLKAPRWWPQQGTADHKQRLRNAEKLLVEEELEEKTRGVH